MKKFLAGITAVATITFTMLSTLCACSGGDEGAGLSREYYAMSTYARLVAAQVEEADFNTLSDEVGAFLSAAENSLSASRPKSFISIFNQAAAGATVVLDEISYEVLSLAKEMYAETDGYFNPAVYYSEDIYGFVTRTAGTGAMPYDREDNTKTLPDDKYVTAFRELATHFSEVELFELYGTYYATKPKFTVKIDGDEREYSLALDLGGIAKGWCVDRVNTMLAEAGVEYGYFNFGESSMSVKSHAVEGSYSVTARNPRGSGAYMNFKMKDANLSTSGDNNKYYEIDGKRYCHIINPLTGSPIETGVASVTVVGGAAGRSDALTTALAAMGKESAAQFINENLSDCKVIMLVFEDGAGKVITNAPEYFEIKNKNYVLANTVKNGKIVLN